MRHAAWILGGTILIAGCGGSDTTAEPVATDADASDVESDTADATSDVAQETPIDTGIDAGDTRPGPPVYDEHATDRLGCAYGPGDKTTRTVGPSVPHGAALPFDHVVVLMMENRS